MRRVWGWTPASSAATEITNSARSSGREVPPEPGLLRGSDPGPVFTWSAMGVAALPFHVQVRSGRGVRQRGELAQQLPLAAGELLGHAHLHGDQQIAGQLAG